MLKAGFARVDVTPPIGCYISGYYEPRIAEKIYDPLEAHVLAVSDGENKAVLIALDVIGLKQENFDVMRERIGETLGIPRSAIFVTCSHTHTGPEMNKGRLFPIDEKYNARFEKVLEQAAQRAIDDMVEAEVLTAAGKVENVTFLRRFKMKDGTTRTNPGRRNPEIDAPIGECDEELKLVRIVRKDAEEIVLVNFQVHPDVLGADLHNMPKGISADYPGYMRRTLEGALPGVKAIYLNGAAGNLNHINVNAPEWDANGGFEHSAYMGRAIAAEALRVYTKARPTCAEGVRFVETQISIPSNRGKAEDLPRAYQIKQWHEEGRDDLIPEKGMGITTLVAEATRMIRLKDGPDAFDLNLSALAIGDICIAGIPGEGFTEIGLHIKRNSAYPVQLIAGIMNGYEGYFPMRDSFDEGGYEARSSIFKAGVAEAIAEGQVAQVNKLRAESK